MQLKPGDHTVCGSCAGPLRFDDNLRFVALTTADLEAMYASHPAKLLDLANIAERVLLYRKSHPVADVRRGPRA